MSSLVHDPNEKRCKREKVSDTFSGTILFLLKAVLVVAVLLTFRRFILDTNDTVETVAMIIAFSAITITLIRVVVGIRSLGKMLQSKAMNDERQSQVV
ncbi:hypothetical protein Pla52n_70500 [Stieleria varia]|uniref:Uncharacterized protein n=1 Tax=Stieleria varia TaxID=2528005 RepID=A0A5C5ZIJ5_9BACT|nr:hypothetical protein Pla52n_70500 [Stieleria varia]